MSPVTFTSGVARKALDSLIRKRDDAPLRPGSLACAFALGHTPCPEMAQQLPPDAPPVPPAECSYVRTQLDAYVDGEFAPHDEHDRLPVPILKAHLRDCAACARAARHMTALLSAVRALGAREEATVRASDELRRRAAEILSSR